MCNMNMAFLTRLITPEHGTSASGTQRIAAADKFLQEVLDEVQCLDELTVLYGVSTLAHVTYLVAAIMKGTFIDYSPGDSMILALLTKLPTGAVWKTYVAVESVR